MSYSKILALALALGIGLGLSAASAHARTIPGAAGMNAALGSANEFAWLNTGIIAPNATAASPKIFVVPVVLDTAGDKGFIVRGASSGLSCFVEQRGSVQQSVAVPVSAVGTFPVPVVINVVAGNTVVVRCTFTNSNGRLLLVDHNP